jgi:hypothetical protein
VTKQNGINGREEKRIKDVQQFDFMFIRMVLQVDTTNISIFLKKQSK